MAEEKLQYQVTFRTRSEGDGAQRTAAGIREIREEKEKLNAMDGPGAGLGGGGAASVREVTDAIEQQAESVELLQQREDDVNRARKMASDRRIAQMEDELRAEKDLADAARMSAAARVTAATAIAITVQRSMQLVGDSISQLKTLAPEVADQFSTAELAIQTLTDPIGTLIEAVTGAQADLNALAKSRAEAHRMEQVYLAAVKAKQDEIRTANQAWVDGPAKRRLQAIKDETAAYVRQKAEVESINKALEAQARLGDAIAIRNGANPNAVAASQAARQTAASEGGSDARIADARQRWEEAIKVAESATLAYTQAKTLNLETEGKEAEMEAAVNARDQAKADLDSVIKQEEAAKAEIAAQGVQSLLEVESSSKAGLQEAAEQTKAALEAEAKEQANKLAATGRQALGRAGEEAGSGLKEDAAEQAKALSATAREALKVLTESLKDGVISDDEIGAVKVAIEQLKGSREKYDGAVQEGLKKMISNVDALIRVQSSLEGKIRDQRIKIDALANRGPGG